MAYGVSERDRVVDGLIDTVERSCKDCANSYPAMVANSISQTHALVHRLPLVKNHAFADEGEHRVTITEHFAGRSASQKRALSSLGKPFSDYAQGALETVVLHDARGRAKAAGAKNIEERASLAPGRVPKSRLRRTQRPSQWCGKAATNLRNSAQNFVPPSEGASDTTMDYFHHPDTSSQCPGRAYRTTPTSASRRQLPPRVTNSA